MHRNGAIPLWTAAMGATARQLRKARRVQLFGRRKNECRRRWPPCWLMVAM